MEIREEHYRDSRGCNSGGLLTTFNILLTASSSGIR
jgi:hypothetical protein